MKVKELGPRIATPPPHEVSIHLVSDSDSPPPLPPSPRPPTPSLSPADIHGLYLDWKMRKHLQSGKSQGILNGLEA